MSPSTNVLWTVTKLILFATLSIPALAQRSEYLKAHNSARRDVGVSDLSWSYWLSFYAWRWAHHQASSDSCNLEHSRGKYGENIYWSSSSDSSPADAVGAWVAEKQDYNYRTNSCQAEQCGHYTQVVWKTTKSVGCSSVNCRGGGTFVVCSYDPPGNWDGQRPY